MAWTFTPPVQAAVNQAVAAATVGQKRRAAGQAVVTKMAESVGSPLYTLTIQNSAGAILWMGALSRQFSVTERGFSLPAGTTVEPLSWTGTPMPVIPALGPTTTYTLRINRGPEYVEGTVGLAGSGADAIITATPVNGTRTPLALELPADFYFDPALDAASGSSLADEIWAGMNGANDGLPSGNDFPASILATAKGRVGLGVKTGQLVLGEPVSNALGWGDVFEAAGYSNATSAPNTRVQTRGMVVGVRDLSKVWRYEWEMDVSNMEFSNDRTQTRVKYATGADVTRLEADGGRSWRPPTGWHAHFWAGMPDVDMAQVDALWASYDVRLVLDDASRPDDRASARYLARVGLDPKTEVLLQGQDTGGYDSFGSSRLRLVPTNGTWMRVHFYVDRGVTGSNTENISALEAGLRANPPSLV